MLAIGILWKLKWNKDNLWETTSFYQPMKNHNLWILITFWIMNKTSKYNPLPLPWIIICKRYQVKEQYKQEFLKLSGSRQFFHDCLIDIIIVILISILMQSVHKYKVTVCQNFCFDVTRVALLMTCPVFFWFSLIV